LSVMVMRWFLLLIVNASAVWAQFPLVNVETVTVGDAGNAADTNGYGGVAYEFNIGKNEITIGQYVAFLNSVAASDHYGLFTTNYNTASDVLGIRRQGASGSYTYSAIATGNSPITYTPEGISNRPVSYTTWFSAARFANWLHNGATNGASTETGAYTLNGATSGFIARNLDARWWIPTEDEWYKAAYYRRGNRNAGYWLYPTQSSVAPGNRVLSISNQANIALPDGNGKYSLTQNWYVAGPNYLAAVGSYSGSAGPYGTFDQGGNLQEWTDAVQGDLRIARGGNFRSSPQEISSSARAAIVPTWWNASTTIRLATTAPLPQLPTLVVKAPSGSIIYQNDPAVDLLSALIGDATVAQTYVIRNGGLGQLSDVSVTKSGFNADSFQLTTPAVTSLLAGAYTTFSVSFSPLRSGPHTAQLSITSNDTNNSPFVINLSGFGLGEDLDTDGDDLNDAAEFTMAALGFNWQTYQPTLVTALYSNANRANLFTQSQYDVNRTNGQTDVMNNPAAFNLFDSTQYEAHRISGVAQGKAEVTSNPTAYSLFTESSIMDMNLGSLMLKKRADANALNLELTIETKDNFTTDGWQVAERITRLVSMVGVQRQFLRVRADAPYVAPNVKMLAHPTRGNILTDGAGRVLYFFTSDTPGGNPMFSGSSWPYVSVPAAPKADASVTATIASSSFGRSNGPFLIINTRPAYTYAGDTTAGQATGHGAGWVWYTIKADGTINQ